MPARYTSMIVFADLQRQLNRLFEQTAELHRSSLGPPTWSPRIDVQEGEDAVIVTAEVPGIAAGDVAVKLKRNVLTISGVKAAPLPDSLKGTFHCLERERGEFHRRLVLRPVIDPRGCRATLTDGLLTIELRKVPDRRDQLFEIPIEEESGAAVDAPAGASADD